MIGTLTVTGDFQMFSGMMYIEIAGPERYDKVAVGGYAALSGSGPGGTVFGNLLPTREAITPADKLYFLTRADRPQNADFVGVTKPQPQADWDYGTNATSAWFVPLENVAAVAGNLGGRVWRDDGAVAGVFEQGIEDTLYGVTVRLRDPTGNTILGTTTTDANGAYLFDDLDPGLYQVEFVRPGGMRFAPQDEGEDDAIDSDPDPATGRVAVDVNSDDADTTSAGLYANTPPIITDRFFPVHKNVGAGGKLTGDATDADLDVLRFSVYSGPSNGTLTLDEDGNFTYVPYTGYVGGDSFTYQVEDGYEGTDTGTVTITVADTPAPVGAADDYTTPAGPLGVDAANGLLANDTDQNNGTLTAVLVSDPSHGTLELNADGSFVYTPNDDFVGTDQFTYTPVDDDGPGEPTTVTIDITDNPPVANDDTTSATRNHPVAVNVLANDTDPDSDPLTVVGASDGIYGTTVVNQDGTITYTPAADFTGADWFVYVIDDGYGRLSIATVSVTVAEGGTVTGRVWVDGDHDGIQDAGETLNVTGRTVYLLDGSNNVVATTTTDGNGEYTFADVVPGQYKVRVDLAPGEVFSPKDQGGDDALDSDVNSSGYTDLFTVTAGAMYDFDIGLYPDQGGGGA